MYLIDLILCSLFVGIVLMSFCSCDGAKQPLRRSSFMENLGFQVKEGELGTHLQEADSEAGFKVQEAAVGSTLGINTVVERRK